MKTSTFSTDCLRAIGHLSKNMQNRIIGDITRYQLTGEIPEKMPPMRRALFYSLILMLNPEADIDQAADTGSPESTTQDSTPNDVSPAAEPKPAGTSTTSAPNYVAIDPSGHAVPLYIPTAEPMPRKSPTRADKRRLMRALG